MSEHEVCLFAQYLAHKLKSPKSIRNYVSGLCTLHILTRVRPPAMHDPEIKLTFRGLLKRKKHTVQRAQPITPEILLDMLTFLDFKKFEDLVFWGILLVGFFGMLRKSNLVSDTFGTFDPTKQLTRAHVSFVDELAVLEVMWAKNLQHRERLLQIPMLAIPDSPLCPVTILKVLVSTKGKQTRFIIQEKRCTIVHL